jgi:uncharacterized protein YegL
MVVKPGGEYANRPLHFIWLLDCSGSMARDNKIQTLNYAIREAIPAMRDEAAKNKEAQVIVHAIKFSDGAQWHIAGTPLSEFRWGDLQAKGETDMGRAFALLAEELRTYPTVGRYLPPVLVLVTDGEPTDKTWRQALEDLLSVPWAQHAVRVAIAVGSETKLEPLEKFIDDPERHPLRADDTDSLVELIRWVSSTVSDTTQGKPQADPPSTQRKGSGSVFT